MVENAEFDVRFGQNCFFLPSVQNQFFQIKKAFKNVEKNDYDAPEAVRPWKKWKKYLKKIEKIPKKNLHPNQGKQRRRVPGSYKQKGKMQKKSCQK